MTECSVVEIKEGATIQDIVTDFVSVYEENKEKHPDKIVGIMMDVVYDHIVKASTDEKEQIAVLRKLVDGYDKLWYYEVAALAVQASSLIATLKNNTIIKSFVAAIIKKRPFNNSSPDERAKFMFTHIKDNGNNKARQGQDVENPVVTENSNIGSQESKDRKLVEALYRESLAELFEYCAFLQKTISKLDLEKIGVTQDISDIKLDIIKFKINILINSENPMDIEGLLERSSKAINISYKIEKAVNIKINNMDIKNKAIKVGLQSFSKKNMSYAKRVTEGITKLIDLLLSIKDKIKAFFINKKDESPSNVGTKRLIMFRQFTGLSKDDVNHLDRLHIKVRKNTMDLRNKLKE